MKIEPLNGLDIIRFGDSQAVAKERFGDPATIKNKNGSDGVSSEIWIYESLGLELYFDPDDDFKLWGIYTTSQKISLEGINPIGLSDTALNSTFVGLQLNVHDGRFKEYSYPNKEIEFWLKDDVVRMVSISPKL